jgi:uncharacterized protein YfaS (alpha-2-macroglobulin family)
MVKTFRLSLILIALVLSACTSRNYLVVQKTNFTDQIDQLQNLEFTFNKEVAPDSLIDVWDSVAYITFEPEMSGKFKWSNRSTLIFSPSGPFAPNTDYKAKFTNLITALSQKVLRFKDPEMRFHTPYLEIQNTYAYWSRNESFNQQVELRVRIIFNYPVDQDDLKKYISLKVDGKPAEFRLPVSELSNEAELAVAINTEKEKISTIEVLMSEGMKATGSLRTNKEPITVEVPVPAIDKLEITDVTTGFEEGQGVISIFTSQPVVAKDLEKNISIAPLVEFQTTVISNGFVIKGTFGDGQTYSLTLHKALKGIFGPTLEDDQIREVTFSSPEPYIAFADETGMYLTPGGSGNLGIKIIGIPKVKITVFKVFENNIQHYLRNGKEWEWYNDENEYHDSYQYRMNEDYGQVIKTMEYSTGSLPKKGALKLLHINSSDLDISSDMKGIYLVRAESPDKAWLNTVQLLSWSDIGLIAKQGSDEIFVAARSIANAQPLSGVTVSFYTSNNQMVHKVTTGGDGVAFFRDIKKSIPGFKISMITARKGNDYNVMLFNRSNVDVTRFDVGGKHTSGLDYDAFIYGDRNLYRPGDSVYCNILLRDFKVNTVTGFPVRFRVIAPDGKDFLKRRINVSSTGSAPVSFYLPAKSYTGTYTCEVLSMNDVLIGSYRIKVEEFMPDRISVNVSADKKNYLPGETLKLTVKATNLFGPPAANRKVENEVRINRKKFTSKAYKEYNFSLTTNEDPTIMSTVGQSVTSAQGISVSEFPLPAFRNIGILDGKIFTTVFDETGRPVNRLSNFDIYTQNVFLGMMPLPGWLSTGKPVSLRLMAVTDKEKATSAPATLEIVMVSWETVFEKNYGSVNYRSQRRETVVSSRHINITAAGYIDSYIPRSSGEYLIRLRLPGSSSWVEESFYAYHWGDSDESTFKVNKDGQVDITFDKASYQTGDKAAILFKTPFTGELLVTVEQNSVKEYHILKADNNGGSLTLNIKDDFIPNVYITATLLRKTIEEGIPLTVAHGYASLKVEKASNRIPISINAPDKIRSHTKQRIQVRTMPGAEITVAVVDEGILQITDYKTPDPYNYFYAKRALEVDSYDLFDELFPELSIRRLATGGDQGFDLGKRLNPLTASRVKLLSLWSGKMTADAKGEAVFTANIPQFSGAVRIMVAAYKGQAFGSAEKYMKVADPVTISSSLPRFMSPGDQVKVSVTLSNTTAKPIKADVEVNTSVASGPSASQLLKATKPGNKQVTIPANAEVQVSYDLTAMNATGNSTVTFKVITSAESFIEKTTIPVRAAVPLIKEANAGLINAGDKITVSNKTSFIPGTGETRLMLTTNPVGQYADQLQYLLNYPYGCIEQVISAAFPQIYFNDLARLLKKPGTGSAVVAVNINEAIRRINAAQQYNGGLVMWPSGGEINWWNSAYAAHFLYEAERAGYSVDRQVVDNLHRFLLEKVKQKGVSEYYYKEFPNNQWIKKTQPSKEIFYSLFVLSLNGKHNLPTMNYYKSRLDLLSQDSRYLLAAAYMLAGDQKSYNAIIPRNWAAIEPSIMTGDSYSSPIRDRALALYTLLISDDNNPQIPILDRQIGEMIKQARWMNTQEQAFSMLALGKLAVTSQKGAVTATVSFNGKSTAFKGEDMLLTLDGTKADIATQGKGRLFWYLESEGLPVSMTVKEEDRTLRVRRQLFTRTGTPIGGKSFRQNDLLVAAISISTTDNSVVNNVVITDILPACFEIENPRLNAEKEMDWIKDRSIPDYMDVRDDRIIYFSNANSTVKTFYYLVRVVNKGIFTHGPAGAEAMYNGQYYSYNGFDKVVVN